MMIHKKIRAGIAVGMLLSCALSAGVEKTPSQQMVIDRQVVTESAKVSEAQRTMERGERLIREANSEFAKGQYENSTEKYLAAIKLFRQAEERFKAINAATFRERIDFCRDQVGRCYYYRAQDAMLRAEQLASAKQYEKAIGLCKEAIEYYPEGKEVLRARIAVYDRKRQAANLREDSSESLILPEKEGQAYRIGLLMRQAAELDRQEQYDKAINRYNEILLMDPYNAEALHNKAAVYRKIVKEGETRFSLEHSKLMTELEWKWANQLPKKVDAPKNELTEAVEKEGVKKSPIHEKLESIMISKLDFENVSINKVIKYLQEESKRGDPENVGVNLFLRRYESEEDRKATAAKREAARAKAKTARSGENAGEEADAEGGDLEGGGEEVSLDSTGGGGEEDNAKKVTLYIENQSLLQTIKALCNSGKLHYRIDPYAVVLAPLEVPLDDFVRKSYPLDQSVLATVEGGGEDAAALQKSYEENGVQFPAGAKIVYDPRVSRLFVTNTPDNLRVLEALLEDALADDDPLVEISARFIEVDQNDLQELGFDYMISYNPANAPYGGSTIGEYDASHRLSLDSSGSGLMRNSGTDALAMVSGTARDGNLSYKVSLFATNQMDSSDTLASPRVTTLHGHEVYIKMTEERPFVDDYDASDYTTSSPGGSNNGSTEYNIYTYVGPFPNFDDPTATGIELRTTPKYDKKRRTIRLEEFAPTVMTFIGYTDYSSYDSDGNVELMRKPIFDKRDIKTTLEVLDGETVVIGGVIDDQLDILDDKIPILGDLPLVGRLFQSRYTKAKKRSLLIFMTCRLVKTDGTPFHAEDRRANGIPRFSME